MGCLCHDIKNTMVKIVNLIWTISISVKHETEMSGDERSTNMCSCTNYMFLLTYITQLLLDTNCLPDFLIHLRFYEVYFAKQKQLKR